MDWDTNVDAGNRRQVHYCRRDGEDVILILVKPVLYGSDFYSVQTSQKHAHVYGSGITRIFQEFRF